MSEPADSLGNTSRISSFNAELSYRSSRLPQAADTKADEFIINWPPTQLTQRLLDQFPNVVKTIQKLVSINTVPDPKKKEAGAPLGPNLRLALNTILDLARKMGFTTYTHHKGDYGIAEIGDAKKAANVYLTALHLDTFSGGSKRKWISKNPFKPVTNHLSILGRGTIDNKGPAAIVLYAASMLVGLPIRKDTLLRIVFFTDEEGGKWNDVHNYLQTFGEPTFAFVPDYFFTSYIIQPLLCIQISGEGKPLPYHKRGEIEIKFISTGNNISSRVPAEVGVGLTAPNKEMLEKLLDEMEERLKLPLLVSKVKRLKTGEYMVVVIVNGKTAPASAPWEGINAIQELAYALEDIGLKDTPPARALFLFQGERGLGYDWSGKNLGINGEGEDVGIQTVTPVKLEADGKGVEIIIDSRIRLNLSKTDVQYPLYRLALDFGFEPEVIKFLEPEIPPLTQKEARLANAAFEKNYGSPPETVVGRCRTLSRAFKNSLTFGMLPPGHPDVMHEINEYITFETIEYGLKIYSDLFYALMADHEKIDSSITNLLGGTADKDNKFLKEIVLQEKTTTQKGLMNFKDEGFSKVIRATGTVKKAATYISTKMGKK